jgi:hypothetical protein
MENCNECGKPVYVVRTHDEDEPVLCRQCAEDIESELMADPFDDVEAEGEQP